MRAPMDTETAFIMLVATTANINSHIVLILPVKSITIRKVLSNNSLRKTMMKDYVKPKKKLG